MTIATTRTAAAPAARAQVAVAAGLSFNSRLLLLNGLAIAAVVINHASHYALITLTQWPMAETLSPAAVIATVGGARYYAFLALEKLPIFSVPAFLFISGFFAAYAARGPAPGRLWSVIRTRLWALLVPYLIWSVVLLGTQMLSDRSLTPVRALARLLYGGALPHYFFVPLLCQLYLVSPWLAALARSRPRALLTGTALIQLAANSVFYLQAAAPAFLPSPVYTLVSKWSLFPMWLFFFSLGIVAGFQLGALKAWLRRVRWPLAALTLGMAALAIAEADVAFRITGANWRSLPLTVPSSLYAVLFVLSFLAFEAALPAERALGFLSKRTYGIYLLHSTVILGAAVAISRVAPALFNFQLVVQPLLVAIGLAAPLLLMTAIARSRFSKLYRHLFG